MRKKVILLALYFGGWPLGLSILASVLTVCGMENLLIISLLPLITGGCVAGVIASRRHAVKSVNLFLLPLSYTAVLWALFMVISGGFYGSGSWLYYVLFHAALAPIYFFSLLMGEGRLLLWAPLAYELAFLLGLVGSILFNESRFHISLKKILVLTIVIILGLGTGLLVQWQRGKTVLSAYGFQYGKGYSSTDLTPYEVTNPNNKLPKLKTEATFTIKNSNEMPILDGAEAAFPVYSAFANAVYENIAAVQAEKQDIVGFTNTIDAYERLLSGEVDIYFGAEPSREQLDMAINAGKELVMTPIGKEAFVFFVNKSNPVNQLKVSEIKGIYSGKVTNWSEVGGNNKRIVAFQRPENSGSQTLLEKIMGDTPIMKPLKEDVPEGMGGIIEQVADYRNYDNSIGFSFRFFATGMHGSQDIKLLAINGVEPNPENISSGRYPFTANLYAITLKDNKKKEIKPFLDWMRSPQGQEIVGKVGYIKMNQ